jgi:hypothetical protein
MHTIHRPSPNGKYHFPTAREILHRARERYRTTRPVFRPNLNDPCSCCGLFTLRALILLARAGRWPLTMEDITYLGSLE